MKSNFCLISSVVVLILLLSNVSNALISSFANSLGSASHPSWGPGNKYLGQPSISASGIAHAAYTVEGALTLDTRSNADRHGMIGHNMVLDLPQVGGGGP